MFAEHLLSAVTWKLCRPAGDFWCWPLVLGPCIMEGDLYLV